MEQVRLQRARRIQLGDDRPELGIARGGGVDREWVRFRGILIHVEEQRAAAVLDHRAAAQRDGRWHARAQARARAPMRLVRTVSRRRGVDLRRNRRFGVKSCLNISQNT